MSKHQNTLMATENEASRRMHEYLVAQQRRKEEYWIRKYGKVLVPRVTHQPESLSRRNAPLEAGAEITTTLPPIRQARARGTEPLFSAKEPIPSFPMKGAVLNANRRPTNLRALVPATLPPIKRPGHELEAERSNEADALASPLRRSAVKSARLSGSKQHSPKQQHPQQLPPLHVAPDSPHGSSSAADEQQQHLGGKFTLPPMDLPSVEGHAWYQRVGAPHAELSRASVHARGNAPTTVRDLQMEVAVLKAIKAREDTLDRLKVACSKLDTGFGGGSPVVLSPVDPLVRLFYRLVGTLRSRTLDSVEAVAAWQRKSGTSSPFIYYGADYLANIGQDLKFLDEVSFMSSRLSARPATQDPFLVDVTPDGVPLEEATTCDLRRGATRFSSEALRIRMARKTLAAHNASARAQLGSPTSLSIQNSQEFAAVLAQDKTATACAFLPEVHQYSAARAKTPEDTYSQQSQSARRQEQRSTPPAMATAARPSHAGAGASAAVDQPSPRPPSAQEEAAPSQLPSPSRAGAEDSVVLFGGSESDVEASAEEQEVKAEQQPSEVEQQLLEMERQPSSEVEEQQPSEMEQQPSPEAEQRASEMERQPSSEVEQQASDVEQQPSFEVEREPSEMEQEQSGTMHESFGEVEAVGGSGAREEGAEAAAWQEQEPREAHAQILSVESSSCLAAEMLEADSSTAAGQLLLAEEEDQVLLQSVVAEAEELLDLDDGHFIDYMVDALVASLEEPHESGIEEGRFTVAGWEIDRELDQMILGIAEDDGVEQELRGMIAQLGGAAADDGSSTGLAVRADGPHCQEDLLGWDAGILMSTTVAQPKQGLGFEGHMATTVAAS